MNSVYRPPVPAWMWPLAVALLLITFFTTTTLGAVWYLFSRVETVTGLWPLLSPATIQAVWNDTHLLRQGLLFSTASLAILLAHEMGHWIACRRYRLAATPPFFLPAPLALGTVGAFIRIRQPIRSKQQLFDVGIAGPIAGFVVLLPILVYGVLHSTPTEVGLAAHPHRIAELYLPGQNLLLLLASHLFHGSLPTGWILEPHPTLLAAWLGMLATALNLIPLGQLDGGHILYALTGSLQRRLALPLWLALGATGLLWFGWWVWCALILAIGLRHPPTPDEDHALDRRRKLFAAVALLILVLSFMPVPVTVLQIPPRLP